MTPQRSKRHSFQPVADDAWVRFDIFVESVYKSESAVEREVVASWREASHLAGLRNLSNRREVGPICGPMSGSIANERDFYRLLLELVDSDDPALSLERLLRQLLIVTGASHGWIELRSTDSGDQVFRRCLSTHGAGDDRATEGSASSTQTLTGTVSAAWVNGSLRIERRIGPRPFNSQHREHFELLVRRLHVCSERLFKMTRPIGTLREQTERLHLRLVQNALDSTNGNVARAARMLGVTRMFVYGRRNGGGRRSNE